MIHTGGPTRIQGKPSLITGCDYRPCDRCLKRVFVPIASKWTTCRPCKTEERN